MSYYDETIKVGDLVTGYHNGYFQVAKIQPREGSSPLASLRKLLDGKLNPAKGRVTKDCDICYCEKVTADRIESEWDTEVLAAERKKEKLFELLEKNG